MFISLSVISALQFAVILLALLMASVGMRASHQVSIGRKKNDPKILLIYFGWLIAGLGGGFFPSKLDIPLDIPWRVVGIIGFLIWWITGLHLMAAHSQLISLPPLLKKPSIFQTLGILSTIGLYCLAYFVLRT